MRRLLFPCLLAILLAISLCLNGCAPKAVRQAINDAQNKAKIQSAEATAKAKVAAATVRAKGTVDDAKADASPVTNPLQHANLTVKKARKPLGVIATVSFVLALASVGLCFVGGLSKVTKATAIIFGTMAVGSFSGLILLPLFPIFVYVGVGLAILLLVYEIIRERQPIQDAIDSKLGVKKPAPVSPVTGATQVQINHA